MINKDEFIDKFKEEFIDADDIIVASNTSFRDLGSWDSLTGMSVLVMIQDFYCDKFSEADLKKCITVEDVYNSVQNLKS